MRATAMSLRNAREGFTRASLTDQDPLGAQGRRVRDEGDLEVWAKPLAGGGQVAVLFDRGKEERSVAVSWQDVGLPYDAEPLVRDLWVRKDVGRVRGKLVARVVAHDAVMIKVTPQARTGARPVG